MRFIIITIALVINLHHSNAQNSADDYAFQLLIGKSYIDKSLSHKGIFFRDMYLPGKVFFHSGDSVDGIYIRYSSLEDQLIWLNKDYGQIMLDKKSVYSFEIKNVDTTYFFRKLAIQSLSDSSEHFFQEYPNQKIKLLVLRKVNKVSSYFTKNKQHFVYKPNPQYVLIINNQEFVLPNTKIKSIYKFFPGKKEKIRNRLEQNTLKVRTENDFVNVIRSIEDILAEK